jgi:hypothetical protein
MPALSCPQPLPCYTIAALEDPCLTLWCGTSVSQLGLPLRGWHIVGTWPTSLTHLGAEEVWPFPRESEVCSSFAAQTQLCHKLPKATLAVLEAAADPALTTDFKTILD